MRFLLLAVQCLLHSPLPPCFWPGARFKPQRQQATFSGTILQVPIPPVPHLPSSRCVPRSTRSAASGAGARGWLVHVGCEGRVELFCGTWYFSKIWSRNSSPRGHVILSFLFPPHTGIVLLCGPQNMPLRGNTFFCWWGTLLRMGGIYVSGVKTEIPQWELRPRNKVPSAIVKSLHKDPWFPVTRFILSPQV